jgi:hypothetical protein
MCRYVAIHGERFIDLDLDPNPKSRSMRWFDARTYCVDKI